jgi:uncharacterized protein YggE
MRYRKVMMGTLAAVFFGALPCGCAATNATKGVNQIIVPSTNDQGILVEGQGEISAAPDMATLSVGIDVTAKTAAEARDAGAQAAAKVIDSIKRDKIDAKDIRTEGFSIQPHYEYGTDHVSRIVGYGVNNNLSVKIHDLSLVSRVVDDATDAGGDAVRVNGVTFEIENAAHARTEARERAVADAKQKAEELAKLAGVTLGTPIAVEEVSFHSPIVTMSAAAAQATTPIEPGESTVSLEVRVRWAIQGA